MASAATVMYKRLASLLVTNIIKPSPGSNTPSSFFIVISYCEAHTSFHCLTADAIIPLDVPISKSCAHIFWSKLYTIIFTKPQYKNLSLGKQLLYSFFTNSSYYISQFFTVFFCQKKLWGSHCTSPLSNCRCNYKKLNSCWMFPVRQDCAHIFWSSTVYGLFSLNLNICH